MISRLLLAFAGALAACGLAVPALAQQPAPPDVPLWRLQANGDAVQTDLGFILPQRIGAFVRRGFTSTRPDGGSVMTWYESADGLKLQILLQLRVDVRGVTMPGADALERNWQLVRLAADTMYAERERVEPQPIEERRIVWGAGRQPNAIFRVLRFPFANAAEIQGAWYRNIGLWGVLVIASGPESRRAEIEAAGRAAIALQWPSAPLGAELRAAAPAFVAGLRPCRDLDRSGSGQAVRPEAAIAGMIGLVLTPNFLDTSSILPHPVNQPQNYCRVETFRLQGGELIALAWRGDPATYPAARYAFMTPDGGTFYQYESFFSAESLPEEVRADYRRLVWLTVSNERQLAALRVLNDWPSYDDAKALLIDTLGSHPPPVVNLVAPPGQISVVVGQGAERSPDAPAAPAPRTD
jgi:hypothetical protein